MIKEKINKLIGRIQSNLTKKKIFIILIIFFIVGSILRINGLGFGFPLILHPDEEHITREAVRMASTGNWEPQVYNRPDHTTIYLNAFLYRIFSIIKYQNSDEKMNIQHLYNNNRSSYIYASRFITAIFGSLMILSMFFLGKEIGGEKVGLFSSFFTAFFPSFIHHSHFVTSDILLAFFTSLVALYTCKYMKRRKVKFLFIGCIFCGLATSVKYPGLITTIMIASAVIFIHWPRKTKILKLGVSSFLVYFTSLFLVTPYLFLNYKATYKALVFESYSYHLGVPELGWGKKLLYYLDVFHNNMGTFLFILFIFSILLIFIEFKKYILIKKYYLSIFLFGVTYWVLMSKVGLHWERWAVPMYIVPLIVVSMGIHYLSRRLKTGVIYIFYVLLCIIFLSFIFRGLYQSLDPLEPNTQNISRVWINENLPKDAKLVGDGYSPILPGRPYSVAEKSIKQYKEEGVDYVVVSSSMYERYLKEKNKYPKKTKFYQDLFEKEKLIKYFSPTYLKIGRNDLLAIYKIINYILDIVKNKKVFLNGPHIKIYKL